MENSAGVSGVSRTVISVEMSDVGDTLRPRTAGLCAFPGPRVERWAAPWAQPSSSSGGFTAQDAWALTRAELDWRQITGIARNTPECWQTGHTLLKTMGEGRLKPEE